jgi:hypothetical protein
VAIAGCVGAGKPWHFHRLFGLLVPLGDGLAGWSIIAPAFTNRFVQTRGLVMGMGRMGGGRFTPTVCARAADIFGGPHFGTVSGLLLTGTDVGAASGRWPDGDSYAGGGTCLPGALLRGVWIGLPCLIVRSAAPRRGARTGGCPEARPVHRQAASSPGR